MHERSCCKQDAGACTQEPLKNGFITWTALSVFQTTGHDGFKDEHRHTKD